MIVDQLRQHPQWEKFAEDLVTQVKINVLTVAAAAVPGIPILLNVLTWPFLNKAVHEFYLNLVARKALLAKNKKTVVVNFIEDFCDDCSGSHETGKCKMVGYTKLIKQVKALKGNE